MKLNFVAYYWNYDGYGRLNSRLIRALQNEGVAVKPLTGDSLSMPQWMQEQEGVDWDNLTISSFNAQYLQPVPGQHWFYTMTEGSLVEPKYIKRIHNSGVERVLVPCEHNVEAFQRSGLELPISILPAGTDPDEFHLKQWDEVTNPFTFLTFADRGLRKGWNEVWDAFYAAFGGKTTGRQDVRLIIKARLGEEPHNLKMMQRAEGADKRIVYDFSDVPDIRPLYEKTDCLALPSRSEGWGMPHREAAMMGIPVIAQRYSGLDDGNLDEWAIALDQGEDAPMPNGEGTWRVADIAELSDAMRWCYENREESRQFAGNGAEWLRQNQTWQHMARNLIDAVHMASPALSLVV